MVAQQVERRTCDQKVVGLTSAHTHSFFTALHEMQTRYSDENSVRLSVRPSVRLSVRHTRDP